MCKPPSPNSRASKIRVDGVSVLDTFCFIDFKIVRKVEYSHVMHIG